MWFVSFIFMICQVMLLTVIPIPFTLVYSLMQAIKSLGLFQDSILTVLCMY